MTTTKIYQVTTEGDEEGRSRVTVGYATGNKVDIEEFFKDRAYYKLSLEPITVINVTPELVKTKDDLKKEKSDLEARLREIKDFLG